MDRRKEYYQEGNTVRVVEMPLREEELLSLPPEEKKQTLPRQRRGLDVKRLGIFVLMTALSVLFALGGFVYLKLNSSITASRSHIYEMEQDLNRLRTENELTASRLKAQVDLAEIYQVATVQLGMVHADGSEKISYEEQVREYVRQYENIPGR